MVWVQIGAASVARGSGASASSARPAYLSMVFGNMEGTDCTLFPPLDPALGCIWVRLYAFRSECPGLQMSEICKDFQWVWLVGATGIEPVIPYRASRKCLHARPLDFACFSDARRR